MVSSLIEQYGIDLTKEKVPTEIVFDRIATLKPETSLGRIVGIRAEKDKERIKNFSTYERRIYDEWHNKDFNKVIMSEEEAAKRQNEVTNIFRALAKQRS